MRKIFLIAIIVISVLLTGCMDPDDFVPVEDYNEVHLAYVEAKQDRTDLENENKSLKADVRDLEDEVEKYKYLLNNLNELLNNVYYMECKNSGYTNWGTGFSIEYNGKIYILTAGHYVEDTEYNTGKYYNFRFKVNNEWIYPQLLIYKVTNTVPDYAIFYSEEINNGLKYDLNNTEPDYRLGIDIKIQENNNWGIGGECGRPIIDLDGEVIGIHVGYLSDIDTVLRAIDKIN